MFWLTILGATLAFEVQSKLRFGESGTIVRAMDRLYSRFAPCWFLCFFALYASICEAKERWLFIGDSITYGGHFTDYVETWFLLNEEDAPEIINLGLGSETVSGLSEEDHPFFRPYVHTRLGQVLEKVKPDVVFAGYGMNCGIYHPFSDERFEAYKNGIDALVETVKASGASVILLTPPPYASRIHKREQPVEGESYSWKAPAADYNEVLATYAEWILSYDEKNEIRAINTRPGLERFMDESYPREPIHPNGFGHELIAESILAGLGKDIGID